MPLINTIHESLPYIDPEPTPTERAAALALITSELQADGDLTSHAALPPLSAPQFTPAMEGELLRIASQTPLTAIDLTRYEAIEAPGPASTSSQWHAALAQAYTSETYLASRTTNLALLDKYGKHAWLIANTQLEDMLGALERDLARRKQDVDAVVIERKTAQDQVAGELRALEETWRKGLGRALETEVAAESLRGQILETRRRDAAA